MLQSAWLLKFPATHLCDWIRGCQWKKADTTSTGFQYFFNRLHCYCSIMAISGANLRINNNCSSMALLRSSSTITSAPGEQRDNECYCPTSSAMISTSISSAGRPLKTGQWDWMRPEDWNWQLGCNCRCDYRCLVGNFPLLSRCWLWSSSGL